MIRTGRSWQPAGACFPIRRSIAIWRPIWPLLDNVADVSSGQTLSDLKNVFTPKADIGHDVLAAVENPAGDRHRRIAPGYCVAAAEYCRLVPAEPQVPLLARTEASLDAFKTVKSGRREVDSQQQSLRQRVAARAQSGASATATLPLDVAEQNTPPTEAAESPVQSEQGSSPAPAENYADRLMNAKKRAKEQIKEQSKK